MNNKCYVSQIRYLGHEIIHNMFVRTNILIRKFSKCTVAVKIVLFKAYCLCLYDASLWKRYNLSALNKMRSCYNRCIKLFFGFKRRDSLTSILIKLGLPSFDNVLANATSSFLRLWSLCNNHIVTYLQRINF